MPDFPFPSLDFPGRTTALKVSEIAEKLGYNRKHIHNLIEDGTLDTLNGKRNTSDKASIRVPIESYRAFIINRMTTPPEHARQHIAKAIKLDTEQLPLGLK